MSTRLLIASDIHGSLPRATLLADLARDTAPDSIILLGDLLYHGPRNPLPEGYAPRDVADTLNDWKDRIIALRGNCDAEVDQMLLHFPLVESAWLFVDGLRIFASHGHHNQLPDRFPDLAEGDVFLCGHTHIPRAETVEGLHVWNPGSVTLPKQGHPAAYGLYEDGVFRVFDLDGAEVLRHGPLRDGMA